MVGEFERDLEKYAEVIVKVGLNLRAGQRLMIGAPFFGTDGTPLEAYPLVRQIVRAAYQAGAQYVGVNWDDEALQRIRVQHAPADTMTETATWKTDAATDYLDHGDAYMLIFASDPDLMNGLDPEKVQAKQQAEAEHLQKLLTRFASNASNWLVVGASVRSWAAKVFPDSEGDEAVSQLWEAIFEACRVKQEDPVAGWQRHIAALSKRAAYLNARRYSALRYAAPGTDLTIGLPERHLWESGGLTAQNGIAFVANIPTEEVFTMPHKDHVDGVVTLTKPLSYAGTLIEHVTFNFSAGRVVDATAKTGQEALDNLLNTDENSRSLGEVALVPHSSPISQTNLLFYNILFDENASNHLALGNAYRFNMDGGGEMTAEEFASAGGNESISHVDFMIGSSTMNVDGITVDGSTEAIMRNGEWAFDV